MNVAELQRAREQEGLGPELTQSTVSTIDGVKIVDQAPSWLAERAQLSLDIYTGARILASEGYGTRAARLRSELGHRTLAGDAAAAVAMLQALRHRVRRGSTLTELAVRSTVVRARGYYGEQHGRGFATLQDPFAWHARVSAAVFLGHLPDLAKGGTHFLAPSVWLLGGATQQGRKLDPLDVKLDEWATRDELGWIGEIPTVDPLHLLLFRREADVSLRMRSMELALAAARASAAGERGPAPGDPDTSSAGGPLVAVAALVAGWWWLA